MRIIVYILLSSVAAGTVSSICNYENSVKLTNRTYNGVKYGDGEYFKYNKSGEERGCVCLKEICARKCCPFGQIFNETILDCDDNSEEFNPPVWKGSKLDPGFNFTARFHTFFYKMNCEADKNETRMILGDVSQDFHLKTDGQLYVTMKNNVPPSLVYGPHKYCIDNFFDAATSAMKLNAIFCYARTKKNNHYTLSASCMLVSCFFIILTVAVYAFLPSLRSTIHGKVMIAYLSSFFVSLLLMAIMLLVLLVGYLSRVACTIMSFVIYFSTLAGFFWLNVMSYDIFRKFNKININTVDSSRFLWYSAYAFGIPTALTILLAALEFSGLPKENTLLPNMRQEKCFLDGTTRLIYMYIPMSILCVANLVFYTCVARRIMQIKKQTQRLRKKDRQQVCLYVKLFAVAGINWILEVISSFYPDLEIWKFTDAYNILVGVIIFLIFVCKKKILVSLQERFKQLRALPQRNNQVVSVSTPISSPANSPLEDVCMTAVENGEKKDT